MQNRIKVDVKIDAETRMGREPSFDRFWIDLGAILASQNGAKRVPKSVQRSIKKLMFFLIGFLSEFVRFWVPKWSQVGTKMG